MFLHGAGHPALVGRADQEHAHALEVAQDRAGQGRPFLRVGAGAQLVHQHQRPPGGLTHDAQQVGDVGAERGKRFLDALLVADVGVDAVEPGEAGFIGGDVQTSMGHHRQQAHRLQRHGFAPGVGPGDEQHPPLRVQRQADGHHVAALRLAQEQRMAGAAQAQAARLRGIVLPSANNSLSPH